MDTYASGTQVQVVIPLVDRGGNAIAPSAVKYRVIDEAGLELEPSTAVSTFTVGDATVTITVSIADNTLAVDVIRGIRSVELTCTVDGNTVIVTSAYIIESATPLIAGVNSFQTLEQAQLNALEVFNLDGWNSATDDQRIIALIESRSKIARLSFVNLTTDQDRVTDSTFSPVDLLAMTQAQFVTLPADFVKALQMAQIVEASDILGYTDSIAQKRDDGLMLDTIGEVKQMFRSAKPVNYPITKKAMAYLFKYISFAAGLGRG